MFDFDDIETAAPAQFAPLEPGEQPGPPGFVARAPRDPLRAWFPLRQLTLRQEWVPPVPPGAESTRRGEDRSHRPVLCVGPPSIRATDWAAPDAFGGQGTDGSGNALAQLAHRQSDELLLVEYPPGSAASGMGDVAAQLAQLLVGHIKCNWVAVGVSVGSWVVVMVLHALAALGPEGLRLVERCERLHMVGFPPPGAGPPQSKPEGLEEDDWAFAGTYSAQQPFAVPNAVSVYHLAGDSVVTREQAMGWFGLQASLQDGSTKGAYPFFGVQGDHGLLSRAWHRTELYWGLANNTWGAGPHPGDAPFTSDVESYQEASFRFEHGPARPHGLLDYADDALLAELDADPDMARYSNMHGRQNLWHTSQNFCGGDAGASIGLDIRMYVNRASKPATDGHVGCQTVSAVRFGCQAGASAFPGSASGVHTAAIEAALDEVTALCSRFWTNQGLTRKMTHQFLKPVYQYQTYRAVCAIAGVKNDGAVYVVKGQLFDLLGDLVCDSSADIINLSAMALLQRM